MLSSPVRDKTYLLCLTGLFFAVKNCYNHVKRDRAGGLLKKERPFPWRMTKLVLRRNPCFRE